MTRRNEDFLTEMSEGDQDGIDFVEEQKLGFGWREERSKFGS